jgi:hypothetical protein
VNKCNTNNLNKSDNNCDGYHTPTNLVFLSMFHGSQSICWPQGVQQEWYLILFKLCAVQQKRLPFFCMLWLSPSGAPRASRPLFPNTLNTLSEPDSFKLRRPDNVGLFAVHGSFTSPLWCREKRKLLQERKALVKEMKEREKEMAQAEA